MATYAEGYDDGWNEALDAILDRLANADVLLAHQVESRGGGFNDADNIRLRWKAQGVRLALDYARGMAR